MTVESPNYDAALVAAIAIHDALFPNETRKALLNGQLTFIILRTLSSDPRPVSPATE